MEHAIPIMEDLFHHFHSFKGSLLDIGCGDGKPRSFLRDAEYWGIDPEDWVMIPKHTFDRETLFPGIEKPFPFFLGVGEYLPFRNQMFDNVLFFSSFDHVQSPREVLRESHRVLKRGGTIVVLLELSDSPSRIPSSRMKKLQLRKKLLLFL
jgi:ubiquinone/menaquinone biosynthesis C-methylase UbiE